MSADHARKTKQEIRRLGLRVNNISPTSGKRRRLEIEFYHRAMIQLITPM
jgi:hypothetical protein